MIKRNLFFATSKYGWNYPSRAKIFTTEKTFFESLKDKYDVECSSVLDGYSLVEDKDLEYFDRVVNKIIDRIGACLEKEYHSKFSSDQWHFILYSYIYDIVTTCYERFAKVDPKKLSECIVVGTDKIWKPIIDYWSFAGVDDELNCYIYSIICEKYGLRVKKKKFWNLFFARFLKYLFFSIAYKAKRVLIDRNKVDPFDNIECEKLLITTRLPANVIDTLEANYNIKNIEESIFVKTSVRMCYGSFINQKRRKKIFSKGSFKENDVFLEVCYKVAVCCLPIPLVEKFKKIKKVAENISDAISTNTIYSSASMGCADCALENIVGSILRNRGVRIIDIQHATGEVYNRLIRESIYNVGFDEYLTWGIPEKGRFYSKQCCISRIPGHGLRVRTETGKSLNRILIVCFPERAQYNMHDGSIVDRYENLCRLLDHLSENKKKDTVLRFKYNKKSKWIERLHTKYPETKIEIIKEKSFFQSVNESALVICEYYGSSFFESIIYGCPTILFEAVPCYLKSQNISEQVSILEKNNICYNQYEGERLADFLNAETDLNKWWKSKQDVVEGFMRNVAGDYSHMKDIWVNEIAK